MASSAASPRLLGMEEGRGSTSKASLSAVYAEESESDEDSSVGFPMKTEYGCNMDVFWLMVIRILHMADKSYGGQHSYSRMQATVGMVHGITLYLLNVALQLSITSFMMLGAVRRQEKIEDHLLLEGLTLEQEEDQLRQAIPAVDASQVQGEVIQDCVLMLGIRYQCVFGIIIFMWVLTMLTEFKEVSRDWTAIAGVPAWEPGMTLFSQDYTCVVSMPRRVRVALIVAVPVVRLCIAVVLLLSGCKFLVYQDSMLVLVVKSLCMSYVLRVDEVVLSALSGDATKRELKNLKLEYDENVTRRLRLWNYGFGGLIHAAAGVLFTCYYLYFRHNDMMGLREACWDFHHAFPETLKLPHPVASFSDLLSKIAQGLVPWHTDT